MSGKKIYNLAKFLWPINRSLTGNGNRKTLKIIKKILVNLKIKEVISDKKVYDWKTPKEWNVKSAYIADSKQKKIIDFKKNNLHLVGYSIPVKDTFNYNELKKNLFFLKKQKKAIPYVTSYYKRKWGFCLSYNQFIKLKKNEKYFVNIDSEIKKGKMTYGELLIKGKSRKEVLLSSYICHPSMGNNELSGPCMLTYIAKWIAKQKNLKYTYRIVLAPETIGSIYYINKNLIRLKKNVIAAFNLNCLGDNGQFSFLPSRAGNSYSDEVAKSVLNENKKKYKVYSWLDRGSDERQYCWPMVDLPMCSVMKSKFHTYKEYHTSEDNLNFITHKGLNESFKIYKKIIHKIETDIFPIATTICEPNLGKRNMYNTTSIKSDKSYSGKTILNILSMSDGKLSLSTIGNIIKIKKSKIIKISEMLQNKKLLKIHLFRQV